MRSFGFMLIVVDIAMLIWRGFSFTTEKEVVDLGPLKINQKQKQSVNWPLYAGGLVLVAGVVMVVADRRKKI
jgi:hypothetical protein